MPLRAVQQASIPVSNLSWLSSYQGFVWVKRDDGFITRIDPAQQQAERPGGRLYRSAALLSGHRRRGRGGLVVLGQQHHADRPRAMKIVASIPAGKVFDQGRLVFADGHIWVITGPRGDRLTGIDAATNRRGPVIKLPVGCSDLAQGAGAVWVLGPVANRVVRSTSPIA
jgi:hypothetical protein